MEAAQIPWWVAAITAIAGSLLLPMVDRIQKWFEGRDQHAMALAQVDDEKDKQFMGFLRTELERSRAAEQSCQENYRMAQQEIRNLSNRCAKLETVVAHLHPEVADEILKGR